MTAKNRLIEAKHSMIELIESRPRAENPLEGLKWGFSTGDWPASGPPASGSSLRTARLQRRMEHVCREARALAGRERELGRGGTVEDHLQEIAADAAPVHPEDLIEALASAESLLEEEAGLNGASTLGEAIQNTVSLALYRRALDEYKKAEAEAAPAEADPPPSINP